IHRDGAFLNIHTHVAGQRQHAVAGDAFENGLTRWWSHKAVPNLEHDVHRAAFFNEPMLLCIRPDELMITFLLCYPGWEQGASVIATGLGSPRTTFCRTCVS